MPCSGQRHGVPAAGPSLASGTPCTGQQNSFPSARPAAALQPARLVTKAGFPVTELTLKDYLARSRKDAREGCTDYRELKKLILGSDSTQAGTDSTAAAEAFSAGDDAGDDVGTAGQRASSDEFGTPDNDYLALAVSADMERIEKRDMARQHVQAFYAARKRRKKARKHK